MNTKSRKLTFKAVAVVVSVSIVTAVAVTVVQHLLLGYSNAGVTGGVVGAVTVAVAIITTRKRSAG